MAAIASLLARSEHGDGGRLVDGEPLTSELLRGVAEAAFAAALGLRLGGGFGYHFIPQLALDVGLSFTFGTFNDLEIESVTLDIDDTKANTSRLDVGLSWYPQA